MKFFFLTMIFSLLLCAACDTQKRIGKEQHPTLVEDSGTKKAIHPSAVKADATVATDGGESPADTAQTNPTPSQGRVCVAPLDYSTTPGKGSRRSPHRGLGDGGGTTKSAGLPVAAKYREVVAVLNGNQQTFSTKHGIVFHGIPLNEAHQLILKTPKATKPYARVKIDFSAYGTDRLCVYNNAFYDTNQVSDKPRRKFCRKCFAEENGL